MVDVRGLPLTTEQGVPLVTEKDAYGKSEYGADYSPSVVVDSDSYELTGASTANKFSKGSPAALPVEEIFSVESEVARSLLGIDRQTTQQGLFSNVSSYGLDPKDWRIDSSGYVTDSIGWSTRPSASGNYYGSEYVEDEKNSAIRIRSNPTPFTSPQQPSFQDLLISPGSGSEYPLWAQYINSLVALYLFKYMVKNFDITQREAYNLSPLLTKYPPINGDFNELYWDKIWLDIAQNRFGSINDYPVLPTGIAYNFNNVTISNFRSAALWGSSNVIITEANQNLPSSINVSWDSFFFSATRSYFPQPNKGHFRLATNPSPEIWEKYFGLRWSELRQDLKDWEFTVHTTEATVTQLEKDLKLPYFVLSSPVVPDKSGNVFSNLWPQSPIGLPTNTNRIGGSQGVSTEIVLRSIRAFRYQPGRISGYTYGVKVSEIGAGPGTILEFGIENDTDSYMFRLSNGSNFSIVRRSTVPLENTVFLQGSGYAENTQTIFRNGRVQYETVIEQKIMNGDPLSGEGDTGYILDPDTVTMYKIEFGWYGAIGARFYAYVPVGNNECRWVTMHTLVIENQLSRPCLADPSFYFKYRLRIQDSSAIRVDQYIDKFGASYYIDGGDEGTLYPLNAQSGVRNLKSPGFSESKTTLNAIDWTTLIGIKPLQFLSNRAGVQIYNKREIFPQSAFFFSQQDCEVKIVRQRGCSEFAYTHQEGYRWNALPQNRRLKARFTIDPYFRLDFPELGISSLDPSTHTAVAAYSVASTGSWRNPATASNWDVIGNQAIRVLGTDLFSLVSADEDFSGGSVALKLNRASAPYLSSRSPLPTLRNVFLPFIYALTSPNQNGYEIELDYFRRDQILLSSIDVLSNEFFIYWTGGSAGGVNPGNNSSIRFGFAWPNVTDVLNPLYSTTTDPDWGVEPTSTYDGQNFLEGLPYDFATEYEENSLYVETSPSLSTNSFNLESGEITVIGGFFGQNQDGRLSVPGVEGGNCNGLVCKAGREVRGNVSIIAEENPNTSVVQYYVQDTESPWPNLGAGSSYTITLVQGNVTTSVSTTGGISRNIGDDTTIYLLPIGTSLPGGISVGPVQVYYSIVYIATIDERSRARSILTSKITPGELPFLRVFVQARQGAEIGGVWIGQRTGEGIRVEPLTPHRCSVSISDTGTDFHSQWSSSPDPTGTVKAITTYTQIDGTGVSTAPTTDASEDTLDTDKSINTSPRKCGSFLAGGIFTASDYPLRSFTQSGLGSSIATYYVTANTPTEIDLSTVFNPSAESIVNDDFANLATFFVARSLSNHDESQNEIYMNLNYYEQ